MSEPKNGKQIVSTTHRAFSPPETSSFLKTLTSVATMRTSRDEAHRRVEPVDHG